MKLKFNWDKFLKLLYYAISCLKGIYGTLIVIIISVSVAHYWTFGIGHVSVAIFFFKIMIILWCLLLAGIILNLIINHRQQKKLTEQSIDVWFNEFVTKEKHYAAKSKLKKLLEVK